MKPTHALLLDLHELHIALLLTSREARWERTGQLLLEEEQVRADEELVLENGTTELTRFLPWARLRRPSSRELAQRCSGLRATDLESTLAGLVHGHRHAAVLAERLLDAALEENELRLATVAAGRVVEHQQAEKNLERLRARVSARLKPEPAAAVTARAA